VVVDPAGTTTVVFAGGGGLLLLIQPDSIAAATIKLPKVFIVASTDVKNSADIVGVQRRSRHGPLTD
jgi:hypothetical protein